MPRIFNKGYTLKNFIGGGDSYGTAAFPDDDDVFVVVIHCPVSSPAPSNTMMPSLVQPLRLVVSLLNRYQQKSLFRVPSGS